MDQYYLRLISRKIVAVDRKQSEDLLEPVNKSEERRWEI